MNENPMPKLRATQQTIVFILFLLMFGGFLLLLPGFAQVDNLLTLLQNVAILGILGLGMAVVVIGRGENWFFHQKGWLNLPMHPLQ